MPWMRFTLVTPVPGSAAEVLDLLNQLEDATADLPGFLMGGVFTDSEVSDRLGRFAVWGSREDADKASTTSRIMHLRSELHQRIMAGHDESLFEVSGSSHKLP